MNQAQKEVVVLDRLNKIIHIDMDCFYAQVEMRDNPKLKGKCVIVSGPPESRSVVCTASYEARKYGVKAGISAFEASKKCPNGIFILPNFKKYISVSQEMHKIFHKYTDIIEPLSLDEAFLDVTINKKGMKSATQVAIMLQNEIFQTLGLTCSVGVSYNKFIAKVASDFKKPSGITVVSPDDAEQFLENLPIKDFHGVGKKSVLKFYDYGIFSGKDFKKLDLEKAEKYFGKQGVDLYFIVRGIDDRQVIVEREAKSIGFERTLDKDIYEEEEIKEKFKIITKANIERLDDAKKTAKTVTVKIKYSDFTQETKSKTLKNHFTDLNRMYLEVEELLEEIPIKNKGIRLIGTSCSNLEDREKVQHLIRFEQIFLKIKY